MTRPLPPLLAWAYKEKWNWLTWRPALYLYLFLFGVVVAAVRAGRWRYLLLAVPVVVQVAAMSIFVVTAEFRYQWCLILVGLLCSGFLLLGVPLRQVAAAGQEGAKP